MPLFDQGPALDRRAILAKLMAMFGGGGGVSPELPASTAFPTAPGGANDMSMAGPWGAGFPPAPTPTPRPDPAAVPVPQQRPARFLNRGQY